MIKSITKFVNITLYHNKDSQKCWRSNEFFVLSDYNALKDYYYLNYPSVSVAAMIEKTYDHKREFYQIILMFDNDADVAEFILKECSDD